MRILVTGGAVTINGDGGQTRDYVCVGDVVNANVLSLTRGDGEIFNIGSGIETSVNELARNILRVTMCKENPKYGEAKLGEQKRSVIDATKAKKPLGWPWTNVLKEQLNGLRD